MIEVLIPDGVRCVADGTEAAAGARIEVLAPQQFEQLRLLLDRMLRPDNPPHGWVRKQLAELAVVKLHAAIHCLRHHYQTETAEGTDRLLTALGELREPLDAEAHGRPGDLAAPWAAVRDLLPDRLLRRLDRSTTDPGSIRFRATAVEEFTLRSRADPAAGPTAADRLDRRPARGPGRRGLGRAPALGRVLLGRRAGARAAHALAERGGAGSPKGAGPGRCGISARSRPG